MSQLLHDIFAGVPSPGAHDEFIKYGKGTFTHKYLLEAKKQKSAWSIKAGSEFANYFVRTCLQRVSGPVHVTGVIVSTFDIHTDAQKLFQVEGVKKFMGIKQLIINTEVKPTDVISLMDKFPRGFFALSFSTPETTLKIKAKAPKSAKPASAGQKQPTPDFCSVKTSDAALVKVLFFDIPDFKEVKIKHTLNITEIALPKGVSDPVQLREQSKRKGTITRIATVDGTEKKSEAPFFA